jgi:hypothetical protein
MEKNILSGFLFGLGLILAYIIVKLLLNAIGAGELLV